MSIYLVFLKAENAKSIFELTKLFYLKVKIESFRRKALPKYFACKHFSRYSQYCGQFLQCVKCLGEHKPKDCPKTKEPKTISLQSTSIIIKTAHTEIFVSAVNKPPNASLTYGDIDILTYSANWSISAGDLNAKHPL